jgi:hypothetical protein
MRDRRYREVKSKASRKEELESFFYWQVLVFVLSEKLIAPIEVFVFFIEADSKVAAGSAERMEEIIVFDAVVRGVVFVFHVFILEVSCFVARIISPIFQPDENVLVFVHQFAENHRAVIIPLRGCPLSVLKLAEVGEVLFDQFVCHVFKVVDNV